MENRQELFQDAEPAADGGRFRLVVGVMGAVVLLAVGWIAISLNDLKEDLASLQQDDSKEIVALKAELAVLKQETREEFHDVKETLSDVWHQHKPAELEFMGVLASLSAREREALLDALESLEGSSQSSNGEGVLPSAPNSGPAPAPSSQDPVPEPAEESGAGPDSTSVPAEEPGAGPGSTPETAEDPGSPSEEVTANFKEYRIQPGDSLSHIAQKHEVSAEALARANGITDPDRIRVGQVLRIPDE
ncbi:MAG: LysM peptidoglycan-binding domain-containing protein [Roseibacillus sp.]|nr:LysM peptidoglycan-binding domain-containing protein [Roseibacillus sp.]